MSIGTLVVLGLAAVPLLALASALAGCWRWKQRRLAALRTASQLVQTARGPVEYAVSGEGPPLLVIHGGMGAYDQALGLGALVNRYAGAARFTVIAPSRPGYLRTPMEVGLTPEEQADALAVLLDHLGIAQVGVLAGSYGGPVAVQFALRHPQRLCALVLLAAITRRCRVGQQWPLSERALLSRPVALFTDFLHWLMYRRARSQPTALVRFFMRRMTVPSVTTTEIDRRIALLAQCPEQIQNLQQQFCSMTPMSLQMIGCLNDEKQIASIPDYPLEEIRAPTLLVHGREDCVGLGIAGAEWAASKIPSARLFAVEQCGHFLLAGKFLPAVFSAIAEFLRRHGPPAAALTPAPARKRVLEK
ncbi:MAG TPA: alpha/beta hydrolase [Gemmataceae bacterium]|nr:alpha/beta hydrolase [Gemmataceae bacterium]